MKLEAMSRDELKAYARKNRIRLYTSIPEKMRNIIRDVEYFSAHHGDAFRYWIDTENNKRKAKLMSKIPRWKIIRNAIRCNTCGDIIESRYRHNFVTCSCGKVSVDGGHDYLRRCSAEPDGYTDLSETVEVDETVAADELPVVNEKIDDKISSDNTAATDAEES